MTAFNATPNNADAVALLTQYQLTSLGLSASDDDRRSFLIEFAPDLLVH